MSSASDQRIRHVAIVLQSLDAATSRGLLAQLPPAQAKSVRQAMVNLGQITPQERALAFQSMKGLIGNVDSKPPADSSPASALLAAQAHAQADQVEWSQSPEPISSSAATSDAFSSAYGTLNGEAIDPTSPWQRLAPEVLADILQAERPTVIATVLNQVSLDRATAIVQALPLDVSTATLAALPHVHLTDPAILKDIQAELDRKIGQYQVPLHAPAQGLAKLSAIISNLPATQRNIWTNSIARANPVLASKLGWNNASIHANHDSSASLTSTSAATYSQYTQPSPSKSTTPSQPIRGTIAVDSPLGEPVVLPFPGAKQPAARSHSDSNLAPTPSPQDTPHPKLEAEAGSTSSPNAFDVLLNYSDRDLVAILHACSPNAVLLALSGASPQFMRRIEKLTPARDLKRLKERLHRLTPINLRDVDSAQAKILETANAMLAAGKVAAISSVTFTAAA